MPRGGRIAGTRHRAASVGFPATPPGGPLAAFPSTVSVTQVRLWASKVDKLAVTAPSMVATATPTPPDMGATDSTAPYAASFTLRYCATVAAAPFQLVAANAVFRSRVSTFVRMLLANVS